MNEKQIKIEIQEFIAERWSEFCSQCIEKGYDEELILNEDFDALLDETLLD